MVILATKMIILTTRMIILMLYDRPVDMLQGDSPMDIGASGVYSFDASQAPAVDVLAKRFPGRRRPSQIIMAMPSAATEVTGGSALVV